MNDPGANEPRRDGLVPFGLASVPGHSGSTLRPDNHAAAGDNKLFSFAVEPRIRLTHYLFRFPAKFHPPVARALVNGYTKLGDRVLDPFCGSGSLLLEAAIAGRTAIGTDVDPLAVFVSRAKTRVYDLVNVAARWQTLDEQLRRVERVPQEYETYKFSDLAEDETQTTIASDQLWVPAIPNLFHWFRRYVVVDLARIHRAITANTLAGDELDFFMLCFASIIRNASNADPVPVSGLEVTAHMRRVDAAGRTVNPYSLFRKAVKAALGAVSDFQDALGSRPVPCVFRADAMKLASQLGGVDAVITSPPYHNAVDYYRRHQLEMFWLGFTRDQTERLALLPQYIGRPVVPRSDPLLKEELELPPLCASWEKRIRGDSSKRADAFRHYCLAMRKVFVDLAMLLSEGSPALFVLGHSKWNGTELPTGDLFRELAGHSFGLVDQLWYPIHNRYMSYSRHNGASIEREYVLVLARSAEPIR